MNAPFAISPEAIQRSEADELLVAPSLERRRLQCYVALLLGDIVALITGFAVAGLLYDTDQGAQMSLVYGQVLLPIFLTLALYNAAYSTDALRDGWRGIFRAEMSMVVAVVVVVFVQFLMKSSAELSRGAFSSGVICAMALIAWTRLQLRSFVTWRCGTNVINELVIDDGGPQLRIPGTIRVSAAAMGIRPNLKDPHSLDRVGLVLRNIDRVIVSCPADRRMEWAMILKGRMSTAKCWTMKWYASVPRAPASLESMVFCWFRQDRWDCGSARSSGSST